jgi:hypothetical protein
MGHLPKIKCNYFKGECANFSFNECPIYSHGCASAKVSTNSHETDNSSGAAGKRGWNNQVLYSRKEEGTAIGATVLYSGKKMARSDVAMEKEMERPRCCYGKRWNGPGAAMEKDGTTRCCIGKEDGTTWCFRGKEDGMTRCCSVKRR